MLISFFQGQGGTLSAFYQSFGRVDQTPVDIVVAGYIGVADWCSNANMAPDAGFFTGGPPPNKRSRISEKLGFFTGGKPPNKRAESPPVYMYQTASNRTVRAITGPLEIGSSIFVPHADWQINEKVASFLAKRQDDAPNDDCAGTDAQMTAASMLSVPELGEHDTIVAKL